MLEDTLQNQSTETALCCVKALSELAAESQTDKQNQESVAQIEEKDRLVGVQSTVNSASSNLIKLERFEISRTRKTKKSGGIKVGRASGAPQANPMMLLDIFEGTAVDTDPHKGQESEHTRQLKEFVFIQQQNAQGDHHWYKKEVSSTFGLSKEELRKQQAKDAKTKKSGVKTGKVA